MKPAQEIHMAAAIGLFLCILVAILAKSIGVPLGELSANTPWWHIAAMIVVSITLFEGCRWLVNRLSRP